MNDRTSEQEARAIRDSVRVERGSSNTPTMSAIADIIDHAIHLGIVKR